jgi:hypothetical protein
MPLILWTAVGALAALLAMFGMLVAIRRRSPGPGSVSGSWIAEYHRATTESYDS